jgi:hypothetical protein
VSKVAALPARRRWAGGIGLRDGHVIYWWVEILALIAFYVIYSAIRNANQGDDAQAFENAKQILDWQRALGIAHEETLQDWALSFKPIVIAANYFYGSMHFVVTIGAGIFLFRKFPDDYPLMRNTIAITTTLALIGFVTYPLMPPRLLPDSFGFVDTLDRYPTFWSFNSGAMSKVSNQYAAMPSVHVAWALWCTLAFYPRVRARAAKVLAILYPVTTIVVIVVTANHYLLDAVGGAVVFCIGVLIARRVTRAGRGEPRVDSTGEGDVLEPDARKT